MVNTYHEHKSPFVFFCFLFFCCCCFFFHSIKKDINTDKELSLVWSRIFTVTCVGNFVFKPEQAAINATVHEFLSYMNADPVNVDSALELFVENVILMPRGAPTLTGKEGKGSPITPVQR